MYLHSKLNLLQTHLQIKFQIYKRQLKSVQTFIMSSGQSYDDLINKVECSKNLTEKVMHIIIHAILHQICSIIILAFTYTSAIKLCIFNYVFSNT